MSMLVVILMAALATAHFAVVQKNTGQSRFVNNKNSLRHYAEAGVRLAIHELTYDVGYSDGNIGTELWNEGYDLGRDGKPGTADEGEMDYIPTPGEPGLTPVSIGPADSGINLIVHTTDSEWSNVKRVVATAFNPEAIASVEVYMKRIQHNLPGLSAVYVQPGIVLDVNGESFRISGKDTNPDGTPGSDGETYAISTAVGNPPGSNAEYLIDQVSTSYYDQIIGAGDVPSIGEVPATDFDSLFEAFKASRTQIIAPGTYDEAKWGDYATNDLQVTYCSGDLHMSGQASGAGVLVVDGMLDISGQFEFKGVVISRGDVSLSGGGQGIHIWGSLILGSKLTTLGMSGNADIVYSSNTLKGITPILRDTYQVLYFSDL